mgnify:CR=1 FL=1
MQNKFFFLLLISLLCINCQGQTPDSISLEVDYLDVDTIDEVIPDNSLYNAKVLKPFFEKLKLLQSTKTGKINIVHIGDSHIQADLMTNFIRKKLQEEFGNAGRGFIFPYSLARTNGSYNERFKSNRKYVVESQGDSK